MTLKEVCEKFGYDEKSFSKNFSRNQEAILKKYGVHLEKQGRGTSAKYYIEEEKGIDERRRELYEKGIINYENEMQGMINVTDLRLLNLEFYILLVIILTPFGAFRGNNELLAKYAGVANNDDLEQAINNLIIDNFIIRTIDKSTNEGYYTISIKRDVEKQLSAQINLTMLKKSKELADKYGKKSWIPLFKIWSIALALRPGQAITNKEMKVLTQLTEYQIRTNTKILEQEGKIISRKIYNSDGEMIYCYGTSRIALGWDEKFSEENG